MNFWRIVKQSQKILSMFPGGSRIFQELLPYTGRIWRTLIDSTFEGDTYIGDIDFSEFTLIEEYEGITDQENLYAHRFQKWERVKNKGCFKRRIISGIQF